MANPQDGNVVAGSAQISASGTTLTIHQQSHKAVIDWRRFDIAPGEHTRFHQPGSASVTLNRVREQDPSRIMGKLTANGKVIIVNPNGVIFGPGSRVDANSLIATTADIDNHRFMTQDRLVFDKPGKPDAAIVNHGHITVKEAGLAALVAPNVQNHGMIEARLGTAHLASADTMTVDLYGDGLVEMRVSDTVTAQLVKNTGTIDAAGGKISLTAAAGRQIVNSLVHVEGELKAPAIARQGGKIIIGAEGSNGTAKSGRSRVVIDGAVQAGGQKGGTITVTGDDIHLTRNARLNADGKTGSRTSFKGRAISDARPDSAGGDIRIGGDYLGSGTTQRAVNLQVDEGAVISARALDDGDGGRVILWSDHATLFRGLIDIRGGEAGGNGGFAETSGKSWLGFRGSVLATAPRGETGTLLMDPGNIVICAFGGATCASDPMAQALLPGGGAFNSGTNNGTSYVDIGDSGKVGSLLHQLQNAHVSILTNAAGTGDGDITLADSLSWSTNYNLTLTAHRDINLNHGIHFTGASNSLTLNAGRHITTSASAPITWSGTGQVLLNAGTAVAGNIVTNAVIQSASAGAANLILRAREHITVNADLRTGLTGRLDLMGANHNAGNMHSNVLGRVDLNAVAYVGRGGLDLRTGHLGNVRHNVTLSADGTAIRYGSAAPAAGNIRYLAGGQSIADATSSNLLRFWGAGDITTTTPMRVNGTIELHSAGHQTLDAIEAGTLLAHQTGHYGAVDITLNGPVTTTGNVTVGAARHLYVNSTAPIQSGATSGVLLSAGLSHNHWLNLMQSGGASGGIVYLNAPVTTGRRFEIKSGPNTATPHLATWDGTDFIYDGQLIGFQSGDIGAAGNLDYLSVYADTILFTGDIRADGGVELRSHNNMTLGYIETGLNAANHTGDGSRLWLDVGRGAGAGSLTLNGTLRPYNSFTLQLDDDNSSGTGRPDVTFDHANGLRIGGALIDFAAGGGLGLADPGRSVNRLLIRGAYDITFDDIAYIGAHAGVDLRSFRHLTLDALDTTGIVNFSAANGNANNAGLLTLNGGVYNIGNTNFQLLSGHDGSGNYLTDVTINSDHMMVGGARFNFTGGTGNIANAGTIQDFRLFGFRDITATSNIYSSGTWFEFTAARHLNLLGVRGHHLYLNAARDNTNGVGLFNLGGPVQAAGHIRLTSGHDGSGNRNSYVFDETNLFRVAGSDVFGGFIRILGFNDVTINRNLFGPDTTCNSCGPIDIIAMRNLTVNGDLRVGSTPYIRLQAAGGNTNNTGVLTINGGLSVGNGHLLLRSGLDTLGERADFTKTIVSTDSLNRMDYVDIQGFHHLNLSSNASQISLSNYLTLIGTGDITLNHHWQVGTGNTVITGNSLTTANNSILAANNGTFSLNLTHNSGIGLTGSLLNLARATLANTIAIGTGSLTLNLPDSVTIANSSLGGNTGNLTVNARGNITLSGSISKTTGHTYLFADAESPNAIFTTALGYASNTGGDGRGAVSFAPGFASATTTSGDVWYRSAALFADGVTAANATLGNGTGPGNFAFSTASGHMALQGFNTITFNHASGFAMSGAGTLELRPGGALSFAALLNPVSTAARLWLAPWDNARVFGVGDGAASTGLFLSTANLNNIGNNWARLDFGDSARTALMEVAARSWRTDTRFFSDSGIIRLLGNHTSQAGADTALTLNGPAEIGGNIDLSAAAGGWGSITLNGASSLTGSGARALNAGAGLFTIGAAGSLNAAGRALTITSNDLDLGGALAGTSTLTLATHSAGRTMAIGTGATGDYAVSDAELTLLQDGFSGITFTTTGAIDIDDYQFRDPITFASAAGITVDGALTTTGNGRFTFNGPTTVGAAINTAGTGSITFGNFTHYLGANLTALGSGMTLGGIVNLTSHVNLTANWNAGAISLNEVNAGAYNLSMLARDLTLNGPISGTGNLSINTGRGFALGNGAAGDFALSDAEMAIINNPLSTWNQLTFNVNGNLNSDIRTTTWYRPTVFNRQAGTAEMHFAGGVASTLASGAALTFAAPTTIAGDVTTQGGNITFNNFQHQVGGNIATDNGALTVNGTLLFTGATGTRAIDTGTGGVTIGATGSLDTDGHQFTLQSDSLAVGGTISGTGTLTLRPATAGRSMGIASANGDWNLNAAEAAFFQPGFAGILFDSNGGDSPMYVGASNWASPVTFRTRNAALTLEGALTSSATAPGTRLILATDGDFINATAADALDAGAGGRWLVYSANPADTTGEEHLANDFNRYGCTYGGGCPTGVTVAAAGNGLIYSYRPTLDVNIGTQSYAYGDAVGSPSAYTLSGFLNATDQSAHAMGGSAVFQTTYAQGMNAGTAYTVSDNGSTLFSRLGYLLNYHDAGGAVGQRAITIRATDQTRTYGFGGSAAALGTTGFEIVAGSLYASAISGVTLSTNAALSGAGRYNATNGTPWSLTPSAAAFSSGLASNYAITYQDAPAGLTVNRASLTVSGLSAVNRVYDGTTAVTVTGAPVFSGFAGDHLSLVGAPSGTMLDKHAGTGKQVNLSGLVLGGTDAGNYTLAAPPSLTVDIARAALTLSGLTGQDKVYDGTSRATFTGVATVTPIGSDAVSVTGSNTGIFLNHNAGSGRAIVATGLSLTGADAGNYTLASQPGLSATIAKRGLTVIANDATRVMGEANPPFSVRFDGFVNGENALTAAISGKAGFFTDATSASGIGSYTLLPSPGSLHATNYRFDHFVAGTLNVIPRRVMPSTVEQVTQIAVLSIPGHAMPQSTSEPQNGGGQPAGNDGGATLDTLAVTSESNTLISRLNDLLLSITPRLARALGLG